MDAISAEIPGRFDGRSQRYCSRKTRADQLLSGGKDVICASNGSRIYAEDAAWLSYSSLKRAFRRLKRAFPACFLAASQSLAWVAGAFGYWLHLVVSRA